MSCPSAESLSVYADGELPPAEVRALESHLIECRRCRASILALRDEASVLGDVLQGRVLEPVRVVEPRARARGLVVGLGPALGIAALVVTVGGWLLETRLPSGTSWLNPVRLMGAYEMLFDGIFVLRDRAPGLIELAIAVGALFSVASVLTFLATSLGKRLAGPTIVLVAAVLGSLASPEPARAIDIRMDEELVVIEAGTKIEETLVVSAETVRVEGEIDGNLVALAERVRIDGVVDGNVIAVGDDVDVTGEIDGTLYVGGERVRIDGEIDDDLYGFSSDLRLNDGSFVERDVAIFGEEVRMEGKTGRDFVFVGDTIEVRGEIGRDLFTRADDVRVLEGTTIARNFETQLHEGESADVAAGVAVGGERIEGVRDHRHDDDTDRWTDGGFYMTNLVLMVSAFLVGMLLHRVRPGLFDSALPTASDFFRELGIGFLTLIVVPIGIAISFATVVGIPIGVIATFLFITCLFVSMIMVAGLLGAALVGGRTDTVQSFGLSLLLGLFVLTIATNLPWIGGLLWIVALLTGTGMLVAHFLDTWRLWASS